MSAPKVLQRPETLTPQECEEIARRVLGMVHGTQAQVWIYRFDTSGIQFARGDTHMASENLMGFVTLQLEAGGRHAIGETTRFDDAGLRALVSEVEAMTKEVRTPGTWSEETFPSILPPQVYGKGLPIFFDATLNATAGETHAEIFRRATDAAEAARLVSAGDLNFLISVRAVLNTRGLWAYERSSYGEFSLTARTSDGTGSGWGWSGYEDWGRVDVPQVITRAIDLAQRSVKPVAVEPGRYTVILEPEAAAELIQPILGLRTAYWAANAADEGSTVFAGERLGTNKIGLQMMDRRLRMVSDPWDSERPASPMSQDWRPLRPVEWFQKGVLRNLAYYPSYARQMGRAPVVNPGGVRLAAEGASQTLDEMIATTKRGIWVNRLSGVAVMNQRTLLLTGTTRDGTFLIENGKITKAIKNFRFMESPFFVFNQLEAWGEPVRASRDVIAPRLKLHDFNFTSLTDAV